MSHSKLPTTEGAPRVRPDWFRRRLDPSDPRGLRRTLAVVGVGLGLGLFSGVLEGINEQGKVALFDHTVQDFLISHRTPGLTAFFEVITGLAGVKGSALLIAIIILLFWRKRRLSVILVSAAAIEAVVAVLAKLAVGRQRPGEALRLVTEHTFSFPSGHTLVAAIVWLLLAYFLARTFKRTAARVATWVIAVAGVLLVAISRIYLGAHWPSDTVASMFLGGAMLSLGLALLAGHEDILPQTLFTRGLRRRILSGFGIALVIVLLGRDWFI